MSTPNPRADAAAHTDTELAAALTALAAVAYPETWTYYATEAADRLRRNTNTKD